MTNAIFLLPAEAEMLEAAAYYERQTHGLGHAFLAEVQRTVERIVEKPRLAPIVRECIRRRLMHRFPFGILYRTDPHEIVIIAVMHLRRRPGYWEDRV